MASDLAPAEAGPLAEWFWEVSLQWPRPGGGISSGTATGAAVVPLSDTSRDIRDGVMAEARRHGSHGLVPQHRADGPRGQEAVVTALLHLLRDDSGYVHGGEHFTPAGASGLIEPYRWAARSRIDGSLVAGDSRDQVAPYGEPRFGPDLAQEVYVPDWYCSICGCSGSVDDEDCDHDCTSQGIGVHK